MSWASKRRLLLTGILIQLQLIVRQTVSYTPGYNYTVNEPLTWWVRPVAGVWSNGVDFTITSGGSTDNVAVTGYRIYRDGQEVGTTSDTTYTDTALSASTLYIYIVRAFDDAQNLSSNSNSLGITTESAGNPTNTVFSWAPINNAASYTFGIERSGSTDWMEFVRTADEFNCQTGTCSFTPPNGDWSDATAVTITGTIVDAEAPTTPTILVLGARCNYKQYQLQLDSFYRQ